MDTLDETLNKLAEIAKPIVKAIEASTPTTKDHYGDYMAAISKLADMVGENTHNVCLGIGVALQRAGANKQGVQSALRILGHI